MTKEESELMKEACSEGEYKNDWVMRGDHGNQGGSCGEALDKKLPVERGEPHVEKKQRS